METRHFLFRGLYICLAVFFMLCSCLPAGAADVSLAWEPSTSPNISGYKLYIGNVPRTYAAPITLGNQTAYTVTGLGTGTWYFAVTAFDANGSESNFSNEVSQAIGTSGHSCNINGDAFVNALDLQALANVILGLSPTSGSYDLNSDGRVDALDLQILNNVILGLRSCP
jgi:hypothetical protein